jgi:hypothetical protein
MGTGCGFPKQDPPPPRLSRDATQLHNTPYNDSCKKLASKGDALALAGAAGLCAGA